MANGEWFTPLDNGLWKDNKTGAIGRLKKGRGRGWYVDEDDQTPMGRRELYQKEQHLHSKDSAYDITNDNWGKAKTKEEREKIDKLAKTVSEDEYFWEAYDEPFLEKSTNWNEVEGKHIQSPFEPGKLNKIYDDEYWHMRRDEDEPREVRAYEMDGNYLVKNVSLFGSDNWQVKTDGDPSGIDWTRSFYEKAKENGSLIPVGSYKEGVEKLKELSAKGKEERTTEQVNNEYEELSKKMQSDDYYYNYKDDKKLQDLRAEYDTLVAQGQEDVNLKEDNYYNPRQAIKDALTNGEFDEADKLIYENGFENEREEFLEGLTGRAYSDYKEHLKDWDLRDKARDEIISGYDDFDDKVSDFARENGITTRQAEDYFETAGEKLGMSYEQVTGRDDENINPMEEWSDTTGTGYSDAQMEELKQKALDSKPTLYEQIHGYPTKEEMDYFQAKASQNEIPSYTKSGNLNYRAFGIERTPENDFSDDGTRFYSYMLDNGMEMTVANGGNDIYLALRHPYDKEISYEEYSSLPHYKDLDMYNGVVKGSVNLNEVVKASNAYMNEYNELKKSKGLAVDNRSTYERRIDDIDNAIKSSKEYADYHRNYYKTGDYSRGRYHDSEARRYDKKVERLEASKQKLISEHEREELRSGLKSRIEKYNDQELHDTAKGWTYPSEVDESDKKTIREAKRLAREEIKNRTEKQTYPYAKNYDPWKIKNEVDDNGYHTEPTQRKKDMENDLKVMERLSKNSGGDLSKNKDYQSLRKQYESEFGHTPEKQSYASASYQKHSTSYQDADFEERVNKLGVNITEAPKSVRGREGRFEKFGEKNDADRYIDLGINRNDYTAYKDEQIISGITGQLSDGIWENSPATGRYWSNMDFGYDEKGNVQMETIKSGWGGNPFATKTDQQVKEYLANKAKQIIKIEREDGGHGLEWDRNNRSISNYLSYNNDVTVADVYSFYDRMKGRKGKKYNTFGKTSFTKNEVSDIKAQVERYKKRKNK